jgi:hypothetical protein
MSLFKKEKVKRGEGKILSCPEDRINEQLFHSFAKILNAKLQKKGQKTGRTYF